MKSSKFTINDRKMYEERTDELRRQIEYNRLMDNNIEEGKVVTNSFYRKKLKDI